MRSQPCKLRALSALILLAGVLFAGRALADSDHCAICGALFGARVYTMQDAVTEEKAQVCEDCVKLSTVCFICGLPVKTHRTELPDGRVICARDARTAVLGEDEARRICLQAKDSLDRLFSRFMDIPDTNVAVTIVDRVRLQELFKFAGRDYVCPNVWGYVETKTNRHRLEHQISLLCALPLASFKATVAHEYAHVWLNENLSEKRKQSLSRDANEGFCELISYRLMDSQNEEAQKKLIKSNAYTRGQIHLYLEAEQVYGFNDILDWVKYGVDDRLVAGELRRVRDVEIPRLVPKPAIGLLSSRSAPPPVPDRLVLRGIAWTEDRPVAIINDRTFGVNEQAQVRMGKTNVSIRCLVIRQDAVRILVVGSGEERELRFKRPAP